MKPMTKLKLYVDNCCFNRPFDDQAQLRAKQQSDYTEFRYTLFEGMTLDDICREAAQAKKEADERTA